MSNTPIIDLRSDTVTRPTPAMREAIARAVVGDDVLGDDPTVLALQERVAAMFGKDAACFVPTGTMANQTAIRAHTEPGDEIIAHEGSHIIHYETGAPAALSGCMIRPLAGAGGLFDTADVEAAIRQDSIHFPHSRLLVIENTHNRGGGTVWPLAQVERVVAHARERGLRTHLDGARLWNACAATGHAPRDYARHFDTISACFSKGLGCPAGSIVVGSRDTIARVARFRKMFGGTMRQSGVLAAAAIFALDHHVERLKDDHANAKHFAQSLGTISGLRLAPDQQSLGVQSNMVFIDLDPALAFDAQTLSSRLKERGVLILPVAPQRLRAVCHLDVNRDAIDRAITILRDAIRA
ncbi:MAG: low specificity L-threonine aldolase [Phycisphaerales bacterium]